MKIRFILTLILSFAAVIYGHSQTFVDMIHAGDKLPDSIEVGGFKEKPAGKCSCRIFQIVYTQDNITSHSKNGSLATVIGIHYNKDSIVTGVIKLTMRFSVEDAKQAYEGQLPYIRRFVKEYPGAKLIKEHKANPNKKNDVNYFAYSLDNGKVIRTLGYILSVLTEEDYLPNSSYKPKFLGSY
jgi:hypothetical protein